MSNKSQSTKSRSQRLRGDDGNLGSSIPAKRARRDTSELVRDEEFWYEDGTIVLIAKAVQFRVYKGILADHSSVFADMFSLPQPAPPSTNATQADCPFVHLDDSAEDLRHILRAVFPRKRAKFIPTAPLRASFPMVSAYARLGHKYQMDDLVEQALDFLRLYFTDDLNVWRSHSAYVPEGWDHVHAIAVVNISRLTRKHSFLPSALAACCALEVQDLMRGFKREDGTVEKLSEEDIVLCLSAARKLSKASASAVVSVFSSFGSAMGCHCDGADCEEQVRQLLHEYALESPQVIANEDPFQEWSYYSDRWLELVSICDPCVELLRESLEDEQQRLWERLPQLLGIDDDDWPQ